MSSRRALKKSIVVSSISDMEDNPASPPMVSALANRIEDVIREMGLSAKITVGAKEEGSKRARNRQGKRSRGTGKASSALTQPSST